MIAYNDFQHSLSPAERASNDAILQLSAVVSEKWQKHVAVVFATAIVEHHGSMPTDEELSRWARTLIGADGTHHLAWKAPDWQVGEEVDMSYVIASVPPPHEPIPKPPHFKDL